MSSPAPKRFQYPAGTHTIVVPHQRNVHFSLGVLGETSFFDGSFNNHVHSDGILYLGGPTPDAHPAAVNDYRLLLSSHDASALEGVVVSGKNNGISLTHLRLARFICLNDVTDAPEGPLRRVALSSCTIGEMALHLRGGIFEANNETRIQERLVLETHGTRVHLGDIETPERTTFAMQIGPDSVSTSCDALFTDNAHWFANSPLSAMDLSYLPDV